MGRPVKSTKAIEHKAHGPRPVLRTVMTEICSNMSKYNLDTIDTSYAALISASNVGDFTSDLLSQLYNQIEGTLESIMAAGVPADRICVSEPILDFDAVNMTARLVAEISFKP